MVEFSYWRSTTLSSTHLKLPYNTARKKLKMKNEIDFLALFTASAKKELARQEVERNREEEAQRKQAMYDLGVKRMAEALGRAEL